MIVKTLKRAAAVAAILSAASVANANVPGMKKFHVGVDIMGTTLNWANKGGQKILPKNPMAFGLNAGADFYAHNGFGAGFELGLEYMQKSNKATIKTGEMVNTGNTMPVQIASQSFKSKLKAFTPYFGITGSYQINQNFKLISMVGAGISITNMRQSTVNSIIADGTHTPAGNMNLTLKKNAFVPMARVGAQYDFNENFGIRANVGYRYVKCVKATQASPLGINIYTMAAKSHSFNYGAGAVVSF